MRIDRGVVGRVTKFGSFSPSGLACGSGANCLAAGNGQGGGQTGAVLPIRNGVAGAIKQVPGTSLYAVACPTAGTCFAVGYGYSPSSGGGGVLDVITNGVPGTPRLVPGISALYAIGCSSATVCVAAGTLDRQEPAPGLVTFTNGEPGSPQAVSGLSLHSGFNRLACPTITRCIATGEEHFGLRDSHGFVLPISHGSPGPVELVPRTSVIGAISCPTSRLCRAIGVSTGEDGSILDNVFVPVSATGKLGRSTRESAAAYFLGSIACPSVTVCVYGGGRITGTTADHLILTKGVVVTSGYRSKTRRQRAR